MTKVADQYRVHYNTMEGLVKLLDSRDLGDGIKIKRIPYRYKVLIDPSPTLSYFNPVEVY